eukprot:TCONS_00047687-protein
MAEGLKSASTVLREFRLILQPSFGPNGKDVLLKSDTGVVYLTKYCGTILKHLEVKHPIGKIIKDTIQTVLNRGGCGGKTFIIVLSNLTALLMRRIVDQRSRSIEKVSFELSCTAISLLKIKNYLYEYFKNGNIGNIVKSIDEKEFMGHYLEKLLMTTYEGKLQTSSAFVFVRLLKSLLDGVKFDENDVIEDVVDHFDDIYCPLIGVSLSESCLIDGYLIQRESNLNNFHIQSKPNFILLGCESADHMAKITMSLNSANINTLIHKSHNYTKIIDFLKEKNVRVIFSEFQLPNKLQSFISKLDIVVVPYVLSTDLERMSLLYDAPIFFGLYDLYNADLMSFCIGKCDSIRSFNVGKINGCLVGPALSGKMTHYVNKQILLGCPSSGLEIQYRKILHDSFKIVLQAYNKKNRCFDLVPAGGAFECYIAKILNDYMLKSIDESERYLCQFLVKSLLSIPKLLHENSHQKGSADRFILNDVLLEGNCVDVQNGRVMDVAEMDCYEAYQSKIDSMMTMLSLAIQLVKIQHIIPVSASSKLLQDDNREENPK